MKLSELVRLLENKIAQDGDLELLVESGTAEDDIDSYYLFAEELGISQRGQYAVLSPTGDSYRDYEYDWYPVPDIRKEVRSRFSKAREESGGYRVEIVVDAESQLIFTPARITSAYPDVIKIEEFITGRSVTVSGTIQEFDSLIEKIGKRVEEFILDEEVSALR